MAIIIANWKSFLTVDESVKLAEELSSQKIPNAISLFVAPSEEARESVRVVLGHNVHLAAQDMAENVELVVVGHSDMRKAGDTEETIALKIRACVSRKILPALCVGEDDVQKLADETRDVILRQLAALKGISS